MFHRVFNAYRFAKGNALVEIQKTLLAKKANCRNSRYDCNFCGHGCGADICGDVQTNSKISDWNMSEKMPISISYDKKTGILSMSVDIRMSVMPLPPGDPSTPPYVYIPAWPLDPNAPIVDDNDEDLDQWEEDL